MSRHFLNAHQSLAQQNREREHPTQHQQHPQQKVQVRMSPVRHSYLQESSCVGRPHSDRPSYKPKLTGYVIRVDNLPEGTTILELRDHIFQVRARGVENVILMTHDRYALVNYQSAEACEAAWKVLARFKFQGTSLECQRVISEPSDSKVDIDRSINYLGVVGDHTPGTARHTFLAIQSPSVKEIEESMQSGEWITCLSNVVELNRAFDTATRSASNVFLIFSVNNSSRSSHYARMASRVKIRSVGSNAARSWQVPSITPRLTPETCAGPEGRIVEDPERQRVFWEVTTHLTSIEVLFKVKWIPCYWCGSSYNLGARGERIFEVYPFAALHQLTIESGLSVNV